MKLLRQVALILLISFVGEILKTVIPLPIPASVYGLVLMLIAPVSYTHLDVYKRQFIRETIRPTFL